MLELSNRLDYVKIVWKFAGVEYPTALDFTAKGFSAGEFILEKIKAYKEMLCQKENNEDEEEN